MGNMQHQVINGFAEAARNIRAGKIGNYHVGDTITTQHADFGAITWDIIGVNADKAMDGAADTLTVQLQAAPLWRWFDSPTKDHPWGFNEWETSDIRKWLQGEFLEGLVSADREAVRPVVKQTFMPSAEEVAETVDSVFLLSASEAGFKADGDYIRNEGPAYELYTNSGATDRRKLDADDDECFWWLRSPNPSHASSVRLVNPDGSLGYGNAGHGNGVAAACVIG